MTPVEHVLHIAFDNQIKHLSQKAFMSSYGCRGYDPYCESSWTGHGQQTLAYKSAKLVEFQNHVSMLIKEIDSVVSIHNKFKDF